MEKTLAQKANHNFDDGDFTIYDENCNIIYFEDLTGYWSKCEFDENNNKIYYEDSTGFWIERIFDENGDVIYR